MVIPDEQTLCIEPVTVLYDRGFCREAHSWKPWQNAERSQ